MKIFEIFDEENHIDIGTLLYFERKKIFIIELMDNLDEWTAPLIFSNFVTRGIYTIQREFSKMWVNERIIPSGRQNIGSILKNHKLQSYDEMKFLELSNGRCSQDSMYIKKIELLPGYVQKRNLKNLIDCVALDNNELLCFFYDDTVKKINMDSLLSVEGADKVLENKKLFNSCQVGVGGYYITFNDSIDIPAQILYEKGKKIPLSYKDFISFVSSNIIDTADACEVLECSRQNISYMVKRNQLAPLKENVKGNLFLKGDIVKYEP